MVDQIKLKIETEYKCALNDLNAIIRKRYQKLNALYIEKRIAIEKCIRIQNYVDEIDDGQVVKDFKAIVEQKEQVKEKTKINVVDDDGIVLKGYLSVYCESEGDNIQKKKEEYAEKSKKATKK
ncbi:hypothetical protein EDEG_00137 [Edhazardia aedis USNM 41457]|uniref:Uncharacterized protein n=1 Tax=Edhazardia aedis (strain USNM 41457) TaxID=1003232 RepID=J9DSQ3_EDHAE|nr:hypothetical protein EDEG_00137 [Edhazardia aedis USNM 41457]|eukprot:EJW04352.1 hypothetical protein EDEG_00137 [Edhazardia aedis USNM 41457]